MKDINYWHFDPGLLLLLAAAFLLYFRLSGWKLKKGFQLYFSGAFLLFLTEASPLHFLGMHYLLSAHMIVHVIILLICGPLLVLGLPRITNKKTFVYKFSAFLSASPWVGWIMGIGMMWFWHIPSVFDSAFPQMNGSLSSHLLPFLQTSSLLVSGVVFTWPILGPVKELRINPLVGVIYLFTACIGCSILGLFLTFAPPAIYKHYLLPDHYGLSGMIANTWGISRQADQQIAGLIMWIPCCFIYLSGSMLLVIRWLNGKEPEIKQSGLILKGDIQ